MLMEWCDAGSLMTALEDGRLQPVGPQGNPDGFEAICVTLLEVAQAMHHLHCMHIVHCDLKAKNVLLSSAPVRAPLASGLWQHTAAVAPLLPGWSI